MGEYSRITSRPQPGARGRGLYRFTWAWSFNGSGHGTGAAYQEERPPGIRSDRRWRVQRGEHLGSDFTGRQSTTLQSHLYSNQQPLKLAGTGRSRRQICSFWLGYHDDQWTRTRTNL